MTQPFLTAEWRYLLMLNWKIDPAVLRPLVPRGTVLDTHDGNYWLSMVGFRFLRTSVLGVPIPGHRNFPEVNLRFYVRPEGETRRAVVFIKEIVPRRAIAFVARALYQEPYVARRMAAIGPEQAVAHPGRVEYSWRQGTRWNRIGATTEGELAEIGRGSVEEFITEHYWGYTAQRDGSTVEYRVSHPRWRTWAVHDVSCDVDMVAEYGPLLGGELCVAPDSVLLAEGSQVAVGRGRRV